MLFDRRTLLAAVLLSSAAVFSGQVLAQDTRVVSEPQIPHVCTTINAQITTSSNAISSQDEEKLDTLRIQKALDTCVANQAVELAPGPGNAFLSGPIELRPGVTLLVDKGVTLFGSRNPKDYELQPGSCGLVSNAPPGCRPLIAAKKASGAAIMGDGIIDGRGGAKILGINKSWWDLAEDARAGGRQQVPRLIEIDHSDNFTLYRITLRNSANFHVVFNHGDGFTVWGLKIDTPKNARNTDGVDPGNFAKNITITHSYIRDGDDNIAIKGGSGPVTNMSVIHNHFYYGHGMSIGSETMGGVSKVLVQDLSLDGPASGIRIKSNPTRGGLVDGITYDDICIRNSNRSIDLDTHYTYAGSAANKLPSYLNIDLHNVRIEGGKQILVNGFDHTHRISIQLDGVLILDNPSAYKFTVSHADVTLGPGPVNFRLAGDDSTERGKPGTGTLSSCSSKFIPFPQN